ncbi:MAG TPA: serine protease [Gammaproteobacteria bacterium]|nr:serine protease [Gammaproteobacteria bacterium]
MRILVGLCLTMLVAVPACSAAGETTASRVFSIASPSVVVVKAFNAEGQALAQGSGVVIAKGVVISNCHVFEEANTDSARIFYHNKRLSAELHYADPGHDLCSFTVKGLPAPSIAMATTAGIKVGENAYAIGAPEGLNLTLSAGLISSLRKVPGGTVIQTTAPISPGSSGGGLFDSQGRLIGITSYYYKKGQQLNFALPVEWIKTLPQRGKTAKQLAEIDIKFRKGDTAFKSGDDATALSFFRPLAKEGMRAHKAGLDLCTVLEEALSRMIPRRFIGIRKQHHRETASQHKTSARCIGMETAYLETTTRRYIGIGKRRPRAMSMRSTISPRLTSSAASCRGTIPRQRSGIAKRQRKVMSMHRRLLDCFTSRAQVCRKISCKQLNGSSF